MLYFTETLTALTLAGLGVEARMLKRNRTGVPVRIHVNGTRGKSTTVRLIAAMCRAHGLQTVAKFTGGEPGFIDVAGVQHPWERKGPARLAEQHRFWRKCAQAGAKVAVLECMAVDPYLQWTAEHRISQATHTVITNVRPDHFEVMGTNLHEVAMSLANTIPTGGQLILGDPTYFQLFSRLAQERGSSIMCVTEDLYAELRSRLAGARDWSQAFLENVATAWLTASTLGVPWSVAEQVLSDWPQWQLCYSSQWSGTPLQVVNMLSANDPVSAQAAWDMLPENTQGIAVYAHRADRPLRLQLFLDALAQEERCKEILITGSISPNHTILRRYRRLSLGQEPGIPVITAVGTKAVLARLTALVKQPLPVSWVLLLGNELGLPTQLHGLAMPLSPLASGASDSIKQTNCVEHAVDAQVCER